VICNVVCSTCSFAKEKLYNYLVSCDARYINNLKEKIEGGELEVTPYVVSDGERLWNIARGYQNEKGFDITLDKFVSIVGDINEAMGIDTSVLHIGDTIYLPNSIEGIV